MILYYILQFYFPFSAWDILRKPDIGMDNLKAVLPNDLVSEIYSNQALALRLHIEARYNDVVQRQMEEVLDIQKSESLQLPHDLPYHKYV